VTLADPGGKLVETDLLEWRELQSLGGPAVKIPMKPFEIRTFKIVRHCMAQRVEDKKKQDGNTET